MGGFSVVRAEGLVYLPPLQGWKQALHFASHGTYGFTYTLKARTLRLLGGDDLPHQDGFGCLNNFFFVG